MTPPLEEHDSTIADLRSLLDRRRRELDGLEQSMANTQDERTRLQLHSTEISTPLVAVRQELDDATAVATVARVAEENGRQQLARMMDEQLVQTCDITARTVLLYVLLCLIRPARCQARDKSRRARVTQLGVTRPARISARVTQPTSC